MKDQLIFDTTSASTIADSDSVGAFLRSSDGTLLTHSDVGGKKALDVSIADGVNVEVDLSHIDDSVRLGDGTSFFTSTSENSDIALDVHISNTSIEVTATQLDIDDLAFATDSVTAHQGGTWIIDSITNVVSIDDNAGSITVDAVNLDIRDLVFATDKVDISGSSNVTVVATQLDIDDLNATDDAVASHLFDGAGTALTSTLVGSDQALDVNVVAAFDDALANTAILSAADTLAVAGTAEKVIAANLASRKYLSVYNNDNRKMYIGGSGVTAANGFPVSPGSYIEMRAGAAVDVYYNSDKALHAIRTLELS